jgi:protein tyrosine/serine phosphatase
MSQPLPNTYWVVPDRLLAGEHPYGRDDSDARDRLDRLRAAGINFFIDLTEVDEMPDYRPLLPAQTMYRRWAIPDQGVPVDLAFMQSLQWSIRAALLVEQRIYVHCRAGIGRTGLVIGCYLAEGGLDGKAALKELNRLWRQSARSKEWRRVPQTPRQADYIKDWPSVPK